MIHTSEPRMLAMLETLCASGNVQPTQSMEALGFLRNHSRAACNVLQSGSSSTAIRPLAAAQSQRTVSHTQQPRQEGSESSIPLSRLVWMQRHGPTRKWNFRHTVKGGGSARAINSFDMLEQRATSSTPGGSTKYKILVQ
jgi:hypothetical protein